MKNTFTLALALAAAVSVSAQKYEFKKESVLKDGVEIAKMTGKSSIFIDANLAVSSLKGDSLMTIRTWKYPNINPKFANLKGFAVQFIGSGKTVIRLSEETPGRREKIWNLIMKDFTQDLIVNDAVSPEAEAAFLALDNTPVIRQAFDTEKAQAEYLKGFYPINRNTEDRLSIRKVDETRTKSGDVTRIQKAYQGETYLATVETRLTDEAWYIVKRKMDKPFVYGNESLEEVPVAAVYGAASLFKPPLLQHNTLIVHSYLTAKDYELVVAVPNKAEEDVVKFLTDNKLL